jgi:hypothetical protein
MNGICVHETFVWRQRHSEGGAKDNTVCDVARTPLLWFGIPEIINLRQVGFNSEGAHTRDQIFCLCDLFFGSCGKNLEGKL